VGCYSLKTGPKNVVIGMILQEKTARTLCCERVIFSSGCHGLVDGFFLKKLGRFHVDIWILVDEVISILPDFRIVKWPYGRES